MPRKSVKQKKKPLTDTERHKRFVEVTREHGISERARTSTKR